MLVYVSGKNNLFLFDISGKAEKNADAELVVQKTALDISAFGYGGARIEADKITWQDTEGTTSMSS